MGEQRSVVDLAQSLLQNHLRGLDGRCSCGARRGCRVYERAQEALTQRRQLPRRTPGAARRDLMRRDGARTAA